MERAGTVDKAVHVLSQLFEAGAPVPLAQLAERAALPKPTLHRLLQSLCAHDLVEQDGEGRYGLGVGLVRLGLGALSQHPIAAVARPDLEREAEQFGETFFLVAARGGRLRVLDKVEGTGVLRVAPDVGAEVPVSTTASGRLYMALEPSALGLPADSGNAHSALGQRGYDVNDGEWIDGMYVAAAAVVARGQLHGCVACAAVTAQLTKARKREALRRVRDVAHRIGGKL